MLTPVYRGVIGVFVTTILLSTLLSACVAYSSSRQAEILSSARLPASLRETSGLWCDGGQVYSINDSGHAAQVHVITLSGKTLARYPVAANNIDWEAITGDRQALYIGDIGNNHGNRRSVVIHKIARAQLAQDARAPVQQLNIRYGDHPGGKLLNFYHDFDAEALTVREQDLLLFSKSWRSGVTRIYAIDKQKTDQLVSPIASFATGNWVVTGADYDHRDGSVLLVGYLDAPPASSAVIARLDAELKLVDLLPLPGAQVEAICVLENGEILYTEEASFWSAAQITRIANPFKVLNPNSTADMNTGSASHQERQPSNNLRRTQQESK